MKKNYKLQQSIISILFQFLLWGVALLIITDDIPGSHDTQVDNQWVVLQTVLNQIHQKTIVLNNNLVYTKKCLSIPELNINKLNLLNSE